MLVAGSLLTTTDGGATWQRVASHGRILSLSIADGVAWVLDETCSRGRARCALVVLTDDLPNTDRWTPHPVQYPITSYARPVLAASSARTALVDASSADASQLLYLTTDGGRHWRIAGAACGGRTLVRVHGRPIQTRWESLTGLTASATGEWWAVCGGGAAAGTETKGIEISSDDGGVWSQVAAFPSIAPYRNPADLPAGDFEGLFAASGGRLVMTTPNEVGISTDRGRSWHGVEGVNLGGVTASLTGSGSRVWVLAPGVGLWRSDGDLEPFERL
jgi:hypothetical protein